MIFFKQKHPPALIATVRVYTVPWEVSCNYIYCPIVSAIILHDAAALTECAWCSVGATRQPWKGKLKFPPLPGQINFASCSRPPSTPHFLLYSIKVLANWFRYGFAIYFLSLDTMSDIRCAPHAPKLGGACFIPRVLAVQIRSPSTTASTIAGGKAIIHCSL